MVQVNNQNFPNIPIITGENIRWKIDLEELPRRFTAVESNTESKFIHFADSENNNLHPKKTKVLCDEWVPYDEKQVNPPTYSICFRCAEELNEELQKYFYDSEEEEWYKIGKSG